MWKQIWRGFDWILFGATTLLVLIGVVIIGSATHINRDGLDLYNFVEKQGLFFALNLFLLFAMQWGDYRKLKMFATPLYLATILILIAVMVVGTSALGAQRWIQIGPITVQPSEISKLLMIIALAKMLESRINQLNTFRQVLPVALFMGVPFVLVFIQPDLGTSLVYLAITMGMLYISNIHMRLVTIVLGVSVACMPFLWFLLKEYQKNRILVFLNPDMDPFGAGYHIIQSKIAIGSGQLFGKGLFAGTQSQLDFLPENHTDFIFSVIGEELGFIGCIIVLLLFLCILYRGIHIARVAQDTFGMLLAIGVISMLGFQVLVNVGMTTGSMPVTGIPLPFISYGVSSLTTSMLAIGLLENIYMRRKKYMF